MKNVGIDPLTIRTGIAKVSAVSDEVKNAFIAGEDIFQLRKQAQLKKIYGFMEKVS